MRDKVLGVWWCGGVGREGGHSYSAQVSPTDMQTFCPLTLGTWPWRVGCQAIGPEPQSGRGVTLPALLAATRPKPSEDTAACVAAKSSRRQLLATQETGPPLRAADVTAR